jgi:cytoskeletal protein CcmA (bactofilin family)
MATPYSPSQAVASGRRVHSTGDSNISSDLIIIGNVSSTGSVTLDGTIEGNVYCTSIVVTANGSVSGGIIAN